MRDGVWYLLLMDEILLMYATITRCDTYSLPAAVAQYVNSLAFTTQLLPRTAAGPLRQTADVATATTTLKTLQNACNIDKDTSALTNGSHQCSSRLASTTHPQTSLRSPSPITTAW